MAVLPFIGPTYQNQSATADQELCMNWYVELLAGSSTPQKAIFLPRPGVTNFCTVPTFPIRGELSMQGRSFFVGGDVLYELELDSEADWPSPTTPTATALNRGTVSTNRFPATIIAGGDGSNQLFITSGGNGYVYDLSANTLSFAVADADMGAFLGGYFIRLHLASSTFAISDRNDGATWDPTQFYQRSLAADPWVSMSVFHGELWLLGEQSSEVWQNAPTSTSFNIFIPIQGATMEQGCAAPFSVARLGSSICWLAQNEQGRLTVCRSSGYNAVPISTNAVNFAIQQQVDVELADAFAYQDQGHEFYVLNLPDANQTWAYDATTGLWAQRDYWNTTTGLSEVARPIVHSVAFGYTLVGDRVTGDILRQDVRLTTDTGGVPIKRVRRAVTLTDEQKWVRHAQKQLVCDVGLGVIRPSPYYEVILASEPSDYLRLGERLTPTELTFFNSIPGASGVGSPQVFDADMAEQPSLVGDSNASILFDGVDDVVDLAGFTSSGAACSWKTTPGMEPPSWMAVRRWYSALSRSSPGVPRPSVSDRSRLPAASRRDVHDSWGWNPISSTSASDGSRPWRPSVSLLTGNSSPSLPGMTTRALPMPVKMRLRASSSGSWRIMDTATP